MKFTLSIVQILVVLLSSTAAAGQPDARVPEQVHFSQHIRPIFVRHCTSCHGGVRQAADLSLVRGEAAMDYIEPGDPEGSWLFARVIEEDDDARMPPREHGPRLSADEVELLRKWIEQGAPWSGHWAYQHPQRQTVGTVSDADWPLQPIDRFVLKQLDHRKVHPAKEEAPERWLRRVSLDLIGLPSTLAERRRFADDLKDRPQSAHEAVVDRLLSSPHFGERWASVWFDLVRYADSRGQGEDSPRTIWKYRDWVIKAFNDDMPYDQFTVKQLAGDLLPDRTIEDQIATAVHRLTHTNEEGGTDDEEFRVEAVIDRVNTVWQTWQGTTFGCVQCHHHPYDPFDHDEYYKFVTLFNNTADCDLSDDWPLIDVPVDHQNYATATKLQAQKDKLTRSIWRSHYDVVSSADIWQPVRIASSQVNRPFKLLVDSKEDRDEFYTSGTIVNGTTETIKVKLPKSLSMLTGLRVTGLPLDPETAKADSEWGFVMSHIRADLLPPTGNPRQIKFARVVGDEPFPRYDPNGSLNEDSKFGFSAYTRIHHPRSAVLVAELPVTIPPGSNLKISIAHRVVELAAFPMLTRRGHFAVSGDESLTALLSDGSIAQLSSKLEGVVKELASIESVTVPVMREREDRLVRPSHLFIKGLFLTKGDQVYGDVPKLLRPEGEPLRDRLEMANWLVSGNNALTARVAVNRFWARIFGVGLVATEEDFGSTGELPSHPLLLDDLAVRFREDYHWSMKSLLRELVLSRTYRQSSRIRPDILADDSSNRWLARGPRHSLPAETVRDQMLSLSGLLSDRMFGKPVFPPLPPGVWKARRGTWKTPAKGEEGRYRRSVYTYVKRSVPFPMFTAFDAPSRDFCQVKRLRSNTPLQALMLMNDSGFVECAQAFAKRMESAAENIESQINWGVDLATCRSATVTEVSRLAELYRRVEEESDADVALQAVASVILNLDEVITK